LEKHAGLGGFGGQKWGGDAQGMDITDGAGPKMFPDGHISYDEGRKAAGRAPRLALVSFYKKVGVPVGPVCRRRSPHLKRAVKVARKTS